MPTAPIVNVYFLNMTKYQTGFSAESLSDIDPPKRCFLVMEHMGAEYIGYLSFENSAFCREIYRVLRDHCGNPINEIGDVDISYAPNTDQLTGGTVPGTCRPGGNILNRA